MTHQFVDRETGRVVTEKLFKDRIIRTVYSDIREKAPFLFDLLTCSRTSALLGALNYDFRFRTPPPHPHSFLKTHGIDLSEIRGALSELTSFRRVFERQIRFEELRPMPEDKGTAVSPADAMVLAGSFKEGSPIRIKEKFFEFKELIGADRPDWLWAFEDGDFTIFRLTPDKYHYNHVPVSGRVLDRYDIDGCFHSCNPGAVVQMVTPCSKNRRVVTIIDTDVDGGDGIGLVAMVEVVALMIGDIVQCYSDQGYHDPVSVTPGLFLKKGQPKSLFRPGSSTTILIFQKAKVAVSRDILENMARADAQSRFSVGFGRPLVETQVKVRSEIAQAK